MARSVWLVTAAALAVPAPAAAQSDVLWRYVAPQSIKFTHVDVAGNLLVAMDTLVVALHADSGTPVWSFHLPGPTQVFRNVLDAYFLIGTGRTVTALDPVTGDTVWRRADLPDLTRTSFATLRDQTTALLQTKSGFAAIDLRTGVTQWDSTSLPAGTVVREYFPLREHNLLLLLARTALSNVALLGVTLDSGRVLWRHDSLFHTMPRFKREKGVESLTDYQVPRMLADTTLLIYFTKDGPMRLDPRTGAVHWRGDALAGTPVGSWEEAYPAPQLLDSLVIVATERQLVALDRTTGALRWRSAQAFRERPTWLVARPGGILVGGFGRPKQFLAALDPATGNRLWPDDLEPKGGATGYIRSDTVYLSNDGVLSRIPLASGKRDEVASILFQGGEQPVRMDTLPGGGFVLVARQNIMRVNHDGTVAYRRYYKAPSASFLAKLVSTALIVGLNVASYAATPAGGMAPIIVRNPVLTARYGRTTEALNYFYIFTATPDSTGREGYSLVLLDRRDGRELGRLWFDERSPDYELDVVSGAVYEKEGKAITARRLRGSS